MSEWTFDGHDLTTAGDYVTSLISGDGLPARRGANVLIPMMDGRMFARKAFDERRMTFGVTFNGTSLADTQANIDTYLGYLGIRSQGYLKHTRADTTVRRAYAEVTARTDPEWKGPLLARMTVDFITEPFFSSTTVWSTSDVTLNTTDGNGVAVDVVNGGTADVRDAVITFTGPLEHPKLLIVANSNYILYNAHLTSDESAVIDVGDFTCKVGSTSMINNLSYSGDTCFVTFPAGATTHCHFTDGSAAAPGGICKVDFYTPYLTP